LSGARLQVHPLQLTQAIRSGPNIPVAFSDRDCRKFAFGQRCAPKIASLHRLWEGRSTGERDNDADDLPDSHIVYCHHACARRLQPEPPLSARYPSCGTALLAMCICFSRTSRNGDARHARNVCERAWYLGGKADLPEYLLCSLVSCPAIEWERPNEQIDSQCESPECCSDVSSPMSQPLLWRRWCQWNAFASRIRVSIARITIQIEISMRSAGKRVFCSFIQAAFLSLIRLPSSNLNS
jgi:hypothetical protein